MLAEREQREGFPAMAAGERRREARYVVDAVNLIAAGESWPLIDISAAGARISCQPTDYERVGDAPKTLEFNKDGMRDLFPIEPRIIRKADLYIVLGFEPPAPNWDSYIRRFDTFHVRELDDHLFD
jgi:hypothetical protein